MNTDYLSVTELSGDVIAYEQLERICNRYYWAGKQCIQKDVLEVACGTGQGLGYLSKLAKTIKAGDHSHKIIQLARKHYGEKIALYQFDAQKIPFEDKSIDIIIIFEAIYYLPNAARFASECRRVLRKGGKVLISTANKDLFDFNPSPFSYKYYGTMELNDLFSLHGFSVECFGNTPVDTISLRQRILRPIKKLAVKLDLIPKTTSGKKFLKRIVFGKMVRMPVEITEGMVPYVEPAKIPINQPDQKHKVIYCIATLHKE